MVSMIKRFYDPLTGACAFFPPTRRTVSQTPRKQGSMHTVLDWTGVGPRAPRTAYRVGVRGHATVHCRMLVTLSSRIFLVNLLRGRAPLLQPATSGESCVRFQAPRVLAICGGCRRRDGL